jgi:hypothetical protein
MAQSQGLSILDIGPVSDTVPVGDKLLTVYGVSAQGIFTVLQGYPELREWFANQVGHKPDLGKLVMEAPGAVAAIIAAGCGYPGNKDAEANAGSYPVETQLDIIEKIGGLTFKNGFGPFAQRVVALINAARSVNFGRVQGMKSPSLSPNSPRPGTITPPSGRIRPGNLPPTPSSQEESKNADSPAFSE